MTNKSNIRDCECWKCDLEKICPYKHKIQRFPKDVVSYALGECLMLPENEKRLDAFKKRHNLKGE